MSFLKSPVPFLTQHSELGFLPKVYVCRLSSPPAAIRNSMMKGFFFQTSQDILNITRGKTTSKQQVYFTLGFQQNGTASMHVQRAGVLSRHRLLLTPSLSKA